MALRLNGELLLREDNLFIFYQICHLFGTCQQNVTASVTSTSQTTTHLLI